MSAKGNYQKSNGNEEFELVGRELDAVYVSTIERAQKARDRFSFTENKNNENKCSHDNLLCYLALREHDISDLQVRLDEQGLSSLGMIEGHVLESIEHILKFFGILPIKKNSNYKHNKNNKNTTASNSDLCRINYSNATQLLSKRSQLLFGSPSKGRRTNIMVTLDSSDIYRYELIGQLLENGMDIARINCAHNTDREWKLIIESIRFAQEQLVQQGKINGDRCMILMDLGGPKIRTGSMQLELRPLRISVPKDTHTRATSFVEGFLDSEANNTELINLEGASPSSFVIAISKSFGSSGELGSLKIGQKLNFRDASDERLQTLTVLERISHTRLRVGLGHTAFLNEGTRLECCDNKNNNYNNNENDDKCSFTVRDIKALPVELKVETGDTLRLYKDNTRLGHIADRSELDGGHKPAGISCTHPEILDQVKVGHRVFIDDGRIGAIVRSSNKEYLDLEITSPKGTIADIRPNKGMNFPDSAVKLPALTPQDLRNLEFVVKYADMVGLSFVHRPEDIYGLHKALSRLGHADLGIVAKIETADSIHNLAKIVIAGLQLPKFAILIARGDLAVEVGFENLAFVQEDILCLCEAAHIPVILATQILESLAESGTRNRAEITDAIIGQRAECVMLNNGVHIIDAVKTLAQLLTTEERHQIKKHRLFREFTYQIGVFED